MIKSFADNRTEQVFNRQRVRGYDTTLIRAAHRKLLIIHAAVKLESLREPPGNRLEALRGDRKGQHSIRVNRQCRICFRWDDGYAYDVEIVDYH